MKPKGIVVPIVSPVDEDERIDEPALRRLTRYLIDSGVHGLLVNGTTGCFAHLEDREQLRSLEIILDEVNSRIPVIANVGEPGTVRALRKAREMELLRPDYLALLAPFYNPMSQAELKRFYERVAGEVKTPAFIYNNPSTTKNDLAVETVVALSENPQLVGIKDSAQDFGKWLHMVRALRGKNFSVMVGTDDLAAAALAAGCDAVIGAVPNFCPWIAVRLYEAVREGNMSLASELQEALSSLCEILRLDFWGGLELALRHLGLCQKIALHPFASIGDPLIRSKVIGILNKHLKPADSPLPRTAES